VLEAKRECNPRGWTCGARNSQVVTPIQNVTSFSRQQPLIQPILCGRRKIDAVSEQNFDLKINDPTLPAYLDKRIRARRTERK
jgi:hypothetical protein